MAPEKCGHSRIKEYSCGKMMEEYGGDRARTRMEVARHDSVGPSSWEVWVSILHSKGQKKCRSDVLVFPCNLRD